MIEGKRRHAERLRRLRAAKDKLGQVVFVMADKIKVEARLSITRGSISGKGHIASRPGEPPNRDTGNLDTNIESYKTGELEAEVRSQAKHAAPLEWGTSKMAARPYMRPATKKMEPDIKKLGRDAVRAVVKGS